MLDPCPCGSGKEYIDCCKVFHAGALAPNALLLMRSRYSAYAKEQWAYIISTTHPENPNACNDLEKWKKEIIRFCQMTKFLKLEILNFTDGSEEAWVSFTAYLMQNDRDASFTEKSYFKKLDLRWLYVNGEIRR